MNLNDVFTRHHQRDLETSGRATFSQCESYRYELVITWNSNFPRVAVIGLNPSTANERENDPTITRLERWARRNGFGSLGMFNAYAFRSTDPRGMKKATDPIGPVNDSFLLYAAHSSDLVIYAWGTNIDRCREECITEMLCGSCTPHAFKITKNGHPSHPLYLSDKTLDSYCEYKFRAAIGVPQ